MKKKLLVMMITVCLAVNFCIATDASDGSLDHPHVTVIFEENTCFNEDEKQLIENMLTGNAQTTVAPYGLSCILFGHDYQEEYVTAIQHQMYTDAPRCVEEVYKVSVCSKCSDTQSTRISLLRIFCCP